MIIRERGNELFMITQHDHALISGLLAEKVKEQLFHGSLKRDSVEMAIHEHDRGWIPVDQYPIMNDQTQLPFSFIDFPVSYKSVIYKHGIDEVSEMDPYAALLCSTHYVQFMSKSKYGDFAKAFLEGEKKRESRLKLNISHFRKDEFEFHLNLLRFCDNLSLFMCLNEPGTTEEEIHFFHRDGIESPFLKEERVEAIWEDSQTIMLTSFPFEEPFKALLKQKVVKKEEITHKGLAQAYFDAPFDVIEIGITGE